MDRINIRDDVNKITILVTFPLTGITFSKSTGLCSDSPPITKKG